MMSTQGPSLPRRSRAGSVWPRFAAALGLVLALLAAGASAASAVTVRVVSPSTLRDLASTA
jgi:hypothetical protein